MPKQKSSIEKLADFPAREELWPHARGFLKQRKCIDGAEELWRIGNSLYDLTSWAHSHPGGSEWLHLTKGTDITEAFESHHLSDKAQRMLPKFFVREAKTERSVPFTFETANFYKTFKRRALVALKDVDYHKPASSTNIIADLLATTALLTCVRAAQTQSSMTMLIAAIFFTWTTVSGHNYFHMQDSFRMYYFDISLMSSKEWRITHVMSHHMYPNTIWDYEMYAFEPVLHWLPRKNKPFHSRFLAVLYSPLIWILTFYMQGVKRYYTVLFTWKKFETRDFVPFVIPSTMGIFAPTIVQAIGVWLIIIGISSFLFSFIAINSAHHHPDIFHDGDIYRANLDWGLLELDAVRDRTVVDDNPFLVLTSFGSHSLHHLLPSVDHGYLPLCQKALEQTCTEFGIRMEKYTQWESIKGQFYQLCRTKPKYNAR